MQPRNPSEDLESSDSIFEQICTAAQTNDRETLTRLKDFIDSVASVDGDDFMRPVTLMGKLGNVDAVNLLLENGANRDSAVLGLAQSKDEGAIELMIELLEKGANEDSAVLGAAKINSEKLVTTLIDFGASISWALYGAAQNGHVELVNKLLDQVPEGNVRALAMTAQGYAQGGYFEQVDELLHDELLIKGDMSADLGGVILGAAQGGYADKMWRYLQQAESLKLNLIDKAVLGAAQGGHIALMEELIKLGGSMDQAVYGLTHARRYEEVDKLLERGASSSLAIQGAAESGHDKIVQFLIETEEELHGEPGRKAAINLAVEAYARVKDHASVQEFLTPETFASALSGYGQARDVKSMNVLLAELKKQDAWMRDWAVQGVARAGDKAVVDALLKIGAKPYKALEGYAKAGHIHLVNDLLERMKSPPGAGYEHAILGYASGGHIKEVENLLVTVASNVPNAYPEAVNYALSGFAKNDLLSSDRSVLYLLSMISDRAFRYDIAKADDKKNGADEGTTVKVLLPVAEKLHALMIKTPPLSYKEAFAQVMARAETVNKMSDFYDSHGLFSSVEAEKKLKTYRNVGDNEVLVKLLEQEKRVFAEAPNPQQEKYNKLVDEQIRNVTPRR